MWYPLFRMPFDSCASIELCVLSSRVQDILVLCERQEYFLLLNALLLNVTELQVFGRRSGWESLVYLPSIVLLPCTSKFLLPVFFKTRASKFFSISPNSGTLLYFKVFLQTFPESIPVKTGTGIDINTPSISYSILHPSCSCVCHSGSL